MNSTGIVDVGSYDEMINSSRIDCQHAETLARDREGALEHFCCLYLE